MSKNRQLFCLFLVLSLVLFACSTPSPARQAGEDFAVYAAAFRFEFKITSLEGLVVSQLSHNLGGGGQNEYLKQQFKDLASPQLTADFVAKNQAEQPLDAIFAGHPEITLLSQAELAEIFVTTAGRDGWKEFHARYPQARGTVSVSMIGYDPSHTHALLMAGMQSAPLSGYGEFLLLEKINGDWQVQKNVMAWIS